eukprot:4567902-Pyramimonas_sp.AAC.1
MMRVLMQASKIGVGCLLVLGGSPRRSRLGALETLVRLGSGRGPGAVVVVVVAVVAAVVVILPPAPGAGRAKGGLGVGGRRFVHIPAGDRTLR